MNMSVNHAKELFFCLINAHIHIIKNSVVYASLNNVLKTQNSAYMIYDQACSSYCMCTATNTCTLQLDLCIHIVYTCIYMYTHVEPPEQSNSLSE